MKNLILIFGLILAIAAQVVSAQSGEVYIDVRTWIEHKADHIDGDTRIHVSDIVDGVNEKFPDKETSIKLCACGNSATEIESCRVSEC